LNIEDLIVRIADQGNCIVATKGNQRKVYSKETLAKSWLTMSNDSFYNFYGFNWVPPLEMQSRIRKTL
jgi:hypothetical protein